MGEFCVQNTNNPNSEWQQRLSPDCIIIIWTEGHFKEQLPQYLLHSNLLKTLKTQQCWIKELLFPGRSRSLRPHSKSSSRALAKLWRVEGCKAKKQNKNDELVRNAALDLQFFCQKNFLQVCKTLASRW